MTRRFDVICLGAGPCGEALTGELKGSGVSLAVIESALVGGECPYWGCMPSKTMIRSADTLAEAGHARELAASRVEWTVDFPKIAARTSWMARDRKDAGAADALTQQGAELIRGTARLAGPGRVEVGDEVLEAGRAVVIATGTRPAIPPIPGLDTIEAWTNRDAVSARELPASLVVIGGGAVGVELAQAFARLGCRVTVIQGLDRLVAGEEPEAGAILGEAFREDGIDVLIGASIERVEASGAAGVRVHLGQRSVVEAERLLLATGRTPNVDGFAFDAVGARQNPHGFVEVDHATLLAAEGVFGGGDATSLGGFTHVAHYHGTVIGRHLRGEPVRANMTAVPRVTFTDPEIGSVGITEAQARERGIDVQVASADVATSARGYIHDARHGVVKLVADRSARVLVGATIVSPRAGEMLGELTLAIRAGIPLDVLDDTLQAFPTFSRVLQGLFAELR
jgi:pyruvate/2-oxoglutarate dehydrogenase complex dihydrolipoamide dehydrogenase (E3) component